MPLSLYRVPGMNFINFKAESVCQDALELVPAKLFQQPCEVKDDYAEIRSYPRTVGWYNRLSAPPVIHLLKPSFFTSWIFSYRYQRTFLHEVGHHVYWTHMSDLTRATWDVFWKANVDHMPTSYAKTGPGEGFAECFEAYYSPKLTPLWAKLFQPALYPSIVRVIWGL